jgi:hypothetical protein
MINSIGDAIENEEKVFSLIWVAFSLHTVNDGTNNLMDLADFGCISAGKSGS